MKKNLTSTFIFSLTLCLFFLGIMVNIQYRTQRTLSSTLITQKEQDLRSVWIALNKQSEKLDEEIKQLSTQYADLTQQSLSGSQSIDKINQDITSYNIVNSTEPVNGAGIIVVFDDELSTLLKSDLIDLLNELWVAGAEAISVNSERINSFTTLEQYNSSADSYIIINKKKLVYPIVVKAIGNSAALENSLLMTNGLVEYFNTFGIEPTISQLAKIELPAVGKVEPWHYAKQEIPKT
ncbi:MAG: DUF881 domain-containing protein [Clostridia bacterium]